MGDIRRIRKQLIPCGDGKFVKIDYGELLKLFDEIETKAKKLERKDDDGEFYVEPTSDGEEKKDAQ